jgi:hypothetical protein
MGWKFNTLFVVHKTLRVAAVQLIGAGLGAAICSLPRLFSTNFHCLAPNVEVDLKSGIDYAKILKRILNHLGVKNLPLEVHADLDHLNSCEKLVEIGIGVGLGLALVENIGHVYTSYRTVYTNRCKHTNDSNPTSGEYFVRNCDSSSSLDTVNPGRLRRCSTDEDPNDPEAQRPLLLSN